MASQTNGIHVVERPTDDPIHLTYLEQALQEAKKAVPSPTAFCVGCVITVPGLDLKAAGVPQPIPELNDVLTTGYSRELTGNTHAEANALAKAYELPPVNVGSDGTQVAIAELLTLADVYTTLEPCSVRTSGLGPCADALVKAKIKRCFIGVGEPTDFVQCEGARKLVDVGIEVVWVKGMEKECLEAARKGHGVA